MLIHRNLLRVVEAASTDSTRYVINSLCINPDGSVKATDGHILVEAKEFGRGDPKEYPVIDGIDAEYLPDGPIVLERTAVLDALKLVPKVKHTMPILVNYMALGNGGGKYKLARDRKSVV